MTHDQYILYKHKTFKARNISKIHIDSESDQKVSVYFHPEETLNTREENIPSSWFPEASPDTEKNQELWIFLQNCKTLVVLEKEGIKKTL